MEFTKLLPKIGYFGTDTVDDTEKTFLYFIFTILLIKLDGIPFFSRFIFSLMVIFVIYKYFNQRETQFMKNQIIYEKYKKDYKYLWINKDLLKFLDEISCIKEVNPYRFTNLLKLANSWSYLLYEKYYLNKKIKGNDVITYNNLINKILNEFHNIIYDTYYDSKHLVTLKKILWSENYVSDEYWKYLSFPLPVNSFNKDDVFI